jgi:hypothetical protein
MGMDAIEWATELNIPRSSAKFVLVIMAKCAGTDLLCWPSISYLCRATSQNRKTVLENLNRLKDGGYISPCEARRGYSGQVVVYRINLPKTETPDPAPKRDDPENQPGPISAATRPVFDDQQARFFDQPGPKTGHGKVIERSCESKQKKNKAAPAAQEFVLPDWVPLEAWNGYLEMRTKKRKEPTTRARELVLTKLWQLHTEGHDLTAVLDNSTVNGWTDVYAGKSASQIPATAEKRQRVRAAFQGSNDKQKTIADRLTGRHRHEPTDRIVDINPAPYRELDRKFVRPDAAELWQEIR